ncbi:hypothetical protein [Clostridium uliginosum]|nr:hypothetical protein [Clostridium uliginosum]
MLRNIVAPFEIPDEFLMAISISNDAILNVEGIIQYSKKFFEK